MPIGLKVKLDEIERRIRGIEIGLQKAELREKQIIIMFKMILDKSINARRSKGKTIKIMDIINYMEQLININTVPEEVREGTDLIGELIKKGMQ